MGFKYKHFSADSDQALIGSFGVYMFMNVYREGVRLARGGIRASFLQRNGSPYSLILVPLRPFGYPHIMIHSTSTRPLISLPPRIHWEASRFHQGGCKVSQRRRRQTHPLNIKGVLVLIIEKIQSDSNSKRFRTPRC